MDQYKEMQDRLAKVGSRPVTASVETVDYSELQNRLSGFVSRPVVEPIPVAPQVLPAPVERKQKSIDVPISSHVQASEPEPVRLVLPSIEQRKDHSIPLPTFQASHSPRTAPQSKGRSSWLLWVGIALFVAFVIAQLIWVMS